MIRRLAVWLRGERGAVSPILALMLVPIIGAISLAGEGAYWYAQRRAMQNAADSAVLAAAANKSATYYSAEVLAIAGTYGFKNGVNNVVVTPQNNQACPNSSATDCYKVTITAKLPLYLTQVVGYQGNVTLSDGRKGTSIIASAMASPHSEAYYCMVGLGSAGIEFNGQNDGFGSCNLRTNGQIKCTATDVAIVESIGGTCNTADALNTSASTFADPYASLNWASKIGDPACGTTRLDQVTDWSAPIVVCSSTTGKLQANVNIAAENAVIIAKNTTIDLGGFNLKTTGSGTLTIVFMGATASATSMTNPWFASSGSNNATVLEIKGPNNTATGTFQNFAIVQDPRLTTAPDFNPKSNDKWTLNVMGVIYAPDTNVDLKGPTYSYLGGLSCLGIVANGIYSNGGKVTANPTSGCSDGGYSLASTNGGRQVLVQ